MLSDSLSQLLDHAKTVAPGRELVYTATPSDTDRLVIKELQCHLRAGLRDCESEIRRLESAQVELSHQLLVTQGFHAPVRALPDDLLRLVFAWVALQLDDPFHRSPYFSRTICAVSRRWRVVAQSTATLWTFFALRRSRSVLADGSYRRTTPWEHFSEVIHLCAHAPINVRWNWDVDPTPLEQFLSHIDNSIEALELRAQWDAIAVLKSRCFQTLRRLKLRLRGDCNRFALQTLSDLHNLQSLCIASHDGISLHDECAAPSITTLQTLALHASPGPPFTFARDFLVKCSLVTSLDLRCIFIDGPPARDSAIISLPSLVTLALSESACALLWLVRAPLTETLQLSTVDDGYVHHSLFAALSTFLASSRCSLTSLSLISSWCSVRNIDFTECVARLQSLHTLAVNSSWDVPRDAPFGITVVQLLLSDAAALPALRKVHFRGHDLRSHPHIVSTIAQFVESRNGSEDGVCRVEWDEGESQL